MRHSENDMEVLYLEGFFHAVLYPESLVCRQAFGAMKVLAAAVADAFAGSNRSDLRVHQEPGSGIFEGRRAFGQFSC